jgi:hypothetical protein
VNFGLKGEPWRGEVKGTFLLRRKGVFYKVITVRRTEDCWWIFYCVDIKSKRKRVLKYKLLGTLETLDNAASKLKDPKDILMIDLDNHGKCKIMTKEQIEKASKRE